MPKKQPVFDGTAAIVQALQIMQAEIKRANDLLAAADAFDKKHQLGIYHPNYPQQKC
jgi:hypothetical protein